MSLSFRWDFQKASSNARKHGVTFAEATTAFGDPLSLTIPDPDHSEGENRFLLMGLTEKGRLVVVSHLEEGDNVRVIGARMATKREREAYENG